jgi:hypothetical protein
MAATALVAVGCVMPNSAAALLKLPDSTMRANSCDGGDSVHGPILASYSATE